MGTGETVSLWTTKAADWQDPLDHLTSEEIDEHLKRLHEIAKRRRVEMLGRLIVYDGQDYINPFGRVARGRGEGKHLRSGQVYQIVGENKGWGTGLAKTVLELLDSKGHVINWVVPTQELNSLLLGVRDNASGIRFLEPFEDDRDA